MGHCMLRRYIVDAETILLCNEQNNLSFYVYISNVGRIENINWLKAFLSSESVCKELCVCGSGLQ